MKKIGALIILLVSFLIMLAQPFCYGQLIGEDVLALTSNGDHSLVKNVTLFELLSVRPYVIGNMLNIKASDGREAKVYEVKSGTGLGNVILLFHDGLGLNENVQREAEQLHSETGFTVLALDFFEGITSNNMDDANKLMDAVNKEHARAIIQSAIDYAGKNGKIQTIGWGFGGSWSLQAALMAGSKNRGCVLFYGMPESDPAKIKELEGPVLGFFAKQDKLITAEVVKEFSKLMNENGKEITVLSYDADHDFANVNNVNYKKDLADEAHKKAVEFIKKNAAVPFNK